VLVIVGTTRRNFASNFEIILPGYPTFSIDPYT